MKIALPLHLPIIITKKKNNEFEIQKENKTL